MLYYRFVVSPTATVTSSSAEFSEARVLIRLYSDVVTATERAVDVLEQHGWKIVSVRHAQQADSIEEFVGDRLALDLFRDAAQSGIACHFTASEATTRETASLN
jgi:hypothetical protein